MSSSDSKVFEKFSGYGWVILALTFLLQAGASLAVFSFGPLAPFLIDDLGITRAQVGMFTSTIYFGMVLFSTHAGWLTDKLGIRFFLLAGPGSMGLVFLSLSLTHSFIPALLIVFIAGVGYQFINPTTVKTLSQRDSLNFSCCGWNLPDGSPIRHCCRSYFLGSHQRSLFCR